MCSSLASESVWPSISKFFTPASFNTVARFLRTSSASGRISYLSTSKRTPESKVIKSLLASMIGNGGNNYNSGNLHGFYKGFEYN